MKTKKPAKILVVDDHPINIRLLQRKLEREKFEVLTALTGHDCLDIVSRELPDIILLDVLMPDMDGIETCKRLKANERTKRIPIIFITAKSSKGVKIQGLRVGAVDYITKPIDLDETLARIKTHLKFRDLHEQNLELEMRLADSRRVAAVGAITEGIAHNLNNFLGVVAGYLDLLRNGYDSPDIVQRSTRLMDEAVQRMVDIVKNLSIIITKDKIPYYTCQPINSTRRQRGTL